MSAKCSKCGMRIFDERGQSWGTQLPNGWVCDDDCELGLSLQPDVITSRDPAAIVDDLKRWNPPEEEQGGITLSVVIPPTLSILTINENFQVHFTEPMPCRWHRFWYRALLGWKWENCEGR